MSKSITDLRGKASSGYPFLAVVLLILAMAAFVAYNSFSTVTEGYSSEVHVNWLSAGLAAAMAVGAIFLSVGLYSLYPNESAVLTLFGDYRGTDDAPGLRWTSPFYSAYKLSQKLQNKQIESIKVNDASGNPIEIGAIVTWHVQDSAKAALTVDDFEGFVSVQIESALRTVASRYSYDNWSDKDHDAEEGEGAPAPVADKNRTSLRDSGEQVAEELIVDVRRRVARAGIDIEDARITHLAYAPEIAQVMLRRQQAAALLASRRLLLRGSVGLVRDVIEDLKKNKIEIDGERQAAMVSNLLVVMVSDKEASPVANVGSLYS
jgi:regulator of protease activity HflC (stomatin/prohibitin superfamily)